MVKYMRIFFLSLTIFIHLQKGDGVKEKAIDINSLASFFCILSFFFW